MAPGHTSPWQDSIALIMMATSLSKLSHVKQLTDCIEANCSIGEALANQITALPSHAHPTVFYIPLVI